MKINNHEQLAIAISGLRNVLSKYSTESVAGWVGTILVRGFVDAARDFRLESPYKQCYFILSLLTTTPDPPTFTQLDVAQLRHIITAVNAIFGYYRTQLVNADISADIPNAGIARFVSLCTFAHYFYSSKIQISLEQQVKRSIDTFSPFDLYITEALGISLNGILRISQWIANALEVRLEEWKPLYIEHQNKHPNAPLPLSLCILIDEHFKIRRTDLIAEHSEKDVAAFWERFVLVRGGDKSFFYPTDYNVAEDRPLFELSSGLAYAPAGNPLHMAVFSRITALLTDSPLRNKFYKHRDKLLEAQTKEAFVKFFGDSASYYDAIYDTPGSHHEHDLVIIWEHNLLVVEAKASPLKEPSRDAERAFLRLKQHFQSSEGIQKAYDQTNRLVQKHKTGEDIELYDQSGVMLVTLPAMAVQKVYSVCVTLDHFGVVQIDLSHLLKKQDADEYPWAVNVYDLEHILGGIKHKGWGPSHFFKYLDERAQLHGNLCVYDELEVAGLFLLEGTFQSILGHQNTPIFLHPSYAEVFEDINEERRGGKKADLKPRGVFQAYTDQVSAAFLNHEFLMNIPSAENTKRRIGRNEICPCGSDKKYKKCCGFK